MRSSEFRDMILKKTPRYSLSVEILFEKLANKQGKGEFSQFGPLYELYVYAFFVGLRIKSRIELPSGSNAKKFVEIAGWKSSSPLIDFLLLTIMSRSEEIGFDWNELEEMEKNDLEVVVKKIITFIEEYAYGGLDYLKSKLEDEEFDNSQDLFLDLIKKVTLESSESI